MQVPCTLSISGYTYQIQGQATIQRMPGPMDCPDTGPCFSLLPSSSTTDSSLGLKHFLAPSQPCRKQVSHSSWLPLVLVGAPQSFHDHSCTFPTARIPNAPHPGFCFGSYLGLTLSPPSP